jgi:hypothetical protein
MVVLSRSQVVAVHAYAQASLTEKLPRGEMKGPQPYSGADAGDGDSGDDSGGSVVAGAIGGLVVGLAVGCMSAKQSKIMAGRSTGKRDYAGIQMEETSPIARSTSGTPKKKAGDESDTDQESD